MRYIKIATKFMPFIHTYGTDVLLPGTSFSVIAYPTKVIIQDITTDKKHEFSIPLTGPVKNFALIQDIEKKQIRLCGEYQEGYALFIIEIKDTIHFFAKKGPSAVKSFSHHIPIHHHYDAKNIAKLDLGISKNQDLDLVRKRCDTREFVPIFLSLCSCYGISMNIQEVEKIPLFLTLKQAIEKQDKISIEDILKKIYLAYFSKGLTPRLIDDEYQGIIDRDACMEEDSMKVLKGLYPLIISMFCTKENNRLKLLASLPKEFVSGRALNFQVDNMNVSFLWKGKELQRLVIETKSDEEIIIDSKHVKEYRYRSKSHKANEPIFLVKGIHYFDRFTR